MSEVVTDIFTAVHKAVWQAISDWTPLSDMVSLSNRIDVTVDDFDADGFKENLGPDETPEIAVLQSEFRLDRFSRSDPGVKMDQSFVVIVTTGKVRPVEGNRIKLAIIEAWIDKGDSLGVRFDHHRVVGWDVAGRDSLVAEATTPNPEERTATRFQVLMRLTVHLLKAFQNRR